MGWEKHRARAYYYRSVRAGNQVRKVYCGGGDAGRAAAEADAARRRQRQADALAWLDERSRLESAAATAKFYEQMCELLTQAVLLAAGFHRLKRSPWRAWDAARAVVERAGRARRPR
jgi:hypothetical protein